MADICKELRKQLHELDVLRKTCGSLLLREGIESDTAKKAVREFDTLAEELRSEVAFYKQPYSKRLDGIERKINNDENLTKWECRVLYNVDWYPGIINFENEGENRQEDMEKKRSDEEKKQDLALVFDTTPNHISLTEEEALSGNIRYHYGVLTFRWESIDTELTMPEEVGRGLDLRSITSIKTNLTMPKKVGGDLDLCNLKSIDADLTMPEEVGGNLDFLYLTSIDTDLTMPRKIGGYLNLGNLKSINTKLTMPKKVGGDLYLNGLTSIKTNLTMPEEVGGNLHLGALTSINTKLTMPKKVRANLDLGGLISIDTDLTMPEVVTGDLSLKKLASAKELILPEEIRRSLYLNGLTTTQGVVKWPSKVGLVVYINEALPQEEREELEKRYPGKIRRVTI